MSDIGLYSGLYETIRQWADLVDDVLVRLKAGSNLLEQPSYNALNKLFSNLASADPEEIDFSDQRVAAIVESKLGNKNIWIELSRSLTEPIRSTTAIPLLENVALCLAERHADTIAKMRWRLP
ncbi:MAG: hypothetical protein U0350_49140 [Caldilineaceae bacterium]